MNNKDAALPYTISVFDARNQLTDTFEPTMDLAQQSPAIQANTAGQSVFVGNNSAISFGDSILSAMGNTTLVVNGVAAGTAFPVGGIATLTGSQSVSYGPAPDYTRYITLSGIPDASALGSGTVRVEFVYFDGKFAQKVSCFVTNGRVSVGLRSFFSYSLSNTVSVAIYKAVVGQQEICISPYTSIPAVTSSTTTFSIPLSNPPRFFFAEQPTAAKTLLLAYRPENSQQPYSWVSVPALLSLSQNADPILGWFAIDAGLIPEGTYEFEYLALDDSGAVVNKQDGVIRRVGIDAASSNSLLTGIQLSKDGPAPDYTRNISISGFAAATKDWGEGAVRLSFGYNDGSGWKVADLTASPDTAVAALRTYYGYKLTEALSAAIYKTIPGLGEVYLGQCTISSVDSPISAGLAKTLVFRNQPATTASMELGYRPIGSTGGYTWIPMSKVTNTAGTVLAGWFSANIGSFPNGDYEFVGRAWNATGQIVATESRTLRLTSSPSLPGAGLTQNNGALGPIGGAGRGLFDNTGKLNLMEMGYVYSWASPPTLLRSATSLDVKYRVSGSNADPSSIVATQDSRGAGWFTLPTATFRPGINYDLDITASDANGVIQRCIAHVTWNGGNPVIDAFIPHTILHFNERSDTTQVTAIFTRRGSDVQVTKTLNPTSNGLFDLDTAVLELVPVAGLGFDYDVVIIAKTGDLTNNETHVAMRLGTGAGLLSTPTCVNQPDLLRLTPPQAGATRIELNYRVKGSDEPYKSLVTSLAAGEFRADLASIGLPANGSVEYEYLYDVFDANGASLGRQTGSFTLTATNGSARRLDWSIPNLLNNTAIVHRRQSSNAFGEVVQEIDGLTRVTDFSYNTLGKLIQKQDPLTDVTYANGYKATNENKVRPTTRYVYDLVGRSLATIDANGNIATQAWLAGGTDGQIVLESHFDALNHAYGSVSHSYDVFGDKRYDINQLGARTDYSYDGMHRLTEVRHPQRLPNSPGNASAAPIRAFDHYGYDTAGHRISHTTTPDGSTLYTETTYYDSLGRVLTSTSFNEFATGYLYTYDATILGLGDQKTGGWRKTTIDAVGRTMIDELDTFGHTTKHQDLSGRTFSYRYDTAGRQTDQIGSNGQNIHTDYYANGYVKDIWDKVTGAYTYYEYDRAGNRTVEAYRVLTNPLNDNGGYRDSYQYSILRYDELNRLVEVLDPKADIKYEYDAVGNRRHMVSVYHDGLNGALRTQDYWYEYDALNRFTITMGTLTGAPATSATDTSAHIVKGTTGVAISYDNAGQRLQADNGVDGTSETYTYSADGYIETVTTNGTLTSRRNNDLLGRVTTYWDTGAGKPVTRTTEYDKDSRLLKQTEESNGSVSTTTYSYYTDATDDAAKASATGAGQLAVSVNTTGSQSVATYTAYEYWDDAKETAVTAVPHADGVNNWRSGYAKHVYDVNGHLAQAIDAGSDGTLGTGDDRVFRYTTDAQGLILVRDEIAAGQVNRVQRFYYANGVRVGDVGNDGPSRTDYAQAIARRGVDHKSYTNWQPVASADFDQNYEPIGPNYPGMTPGSYTVHANGETLQSIARSVWGDSSMWYLIADANGLTGNEPLAAGQRLTLPNKVTNIHNNAGTFRPYNAGEAIGDTSPTLPAPPPPPQASGGGGCGGIGMIIMIVVIIVVTIYTAGAAAVAMSSSASAAAATVGAASTSTMAIGAAALGSSTAIGIGAAAIGGAVGNIAGQLVGMAMGTQEKFSWRSVATSALTAGAMAGMGGVNVAKAVGVTNSVGSAMINAGARSVVSQGISIATNQQHGFNWSSVAVSAVSAGVTQGISQNVLGDYSNMNNQYSGGLASSWANQNPMGAGLLQAGIGAVTSAATRLAVVGGKLSWASVAADTAASFIQGASWARSASSSGGAESPYMAQGSARPPANGEPTSSPQATSAANEEVKARYGVAETTSTSYRGIQLADSGGTMSDAGLSPTEQAMLTMLKNQESGPHTDTTTTFINGDGEWELAPLVVSESPQDPLGRTDGTNQGNGVWAYPVRNGADGITAADLPAYGGPTVANAKALGYSTGYEGTQGGTISDAYMPPTREPYEDYLRGYHGQYHSVMDGPVSGYETTGRFVGATVVSFKNFFSSLTGAGNMNNAGASWRAGNYGDAAIFGTTSILEAGLTVFSGGLAGVERAGASTIVRAEVANTGLQQTGARQVLNPNSLRSWDLADDAYASIRTNTTDVATIAENIGWSESRVARIKEHVFFKEHQLDSGVRRFDADPDIVNAWNRLTTGDHVSADINLLRHEVFESKFEGIFNTNCRTAHDAALRAGRTWTPE